MNAYPFSDSSAEVERERMTAACHPLVGPTESL